MKKCCDCNHFINTENEKGKCLLLESMEELNCCIEDKNNNCQICEIKVQIKFDDPIKLLEFLKIFKEFKIEIQYYWDVTNYIIKLKAEGFTDKEIDERFNFYNNKDFDSEYSFLGAYDDLIKFNERMKCYDDVLTNSIDDFNILYFKTNKMVCVKLLVN